MYILFGSAEVHIFPLFSIVFVNDIIMASFHDFQICIFCRTLDELSACKVSMLQIVFGRFIDKLRKHNSDVIMTSFHVLGI